MKNIFFSLLMYFLTSLICTLIAIMFIEGWPIFVTIAIYIVTYFFAAMLVCKYFPRLWWLAGFIITCVFWIDMFSDTKGLNLFFDVLLHPGKVDSTTFYAFLPVIAIISSVLGSYIGFRLSAKRVVRSNDVT